MEINLNTNTQEDFTFQGRNHLSIGKFKCLDKNNFSVKLAQEHKQIKKYLDHKLPTALNRNLIELTPGRVRAILWQAEAIAMSSDRENIVIINKFECFYRYFLSSPDIWNFYTKIGDYDISIIHERFQQKKLTKEDHKLLTAIAKEVQYKHFIKIFKQERQYNEDLMYDFYDDIKKFEEGLPKNHISFLKMAFYSYFRYITRLNNLTACEELTEYALYRNCISSNQTVNITYFKAAIIFNEYKNILDFGHQFIFVIDNFDFLKIDQTKYFSEYHIKLEQDIECSQSYLGINKQAIEQQLYPTFFKTVKAVLADPWIHRSELITQSSWLVYIKNIAIELGINKFKDQANFSTQASSNDKPYIIFFHGTTWKFKHWPNHNWCNLAKLLEQYDINVYLPSYNKIERTRAEKIAKYSSKVKLLDKMSINDLAAILAKATASVAVDTGFAHLSGALGIPCVSLYNVTNPKNIGAYGNNQIHLYSENFIKDKVFSNQLEKFDSITPTEVVINL